MRELPEGKKIKINEKEFNVSLASTGLELMRGLKGITSLEPYDGMLFDFGTDFRPQMTPKGLEFPIEVAFVKADGIIVEIRKLDPELGFTQSSSFVVQYALEVPVGFFEENNIKVGTKITI